MQAILLATGESNKLQPLSETIPLPLLPVAGKPVMAYPLELLARQGLKRILVSLFQSAGQIEAAFGTGARWGLRLEYMLQPQSWGSAGSLKWAAQQLNETFVVFPADAIMDFALQPLLEEHARRKNVATLISCQKKHRKSSNGSDCSNTSVYIFNPQVLEYIPARANFDIATQLIPALVEAGLSVGTCIAPGYWNGLHSFAEYHEAQKVVLQSALAQGNATKETPLLRHASLGIHKLADGVWVPPRTVVHPEALLIPPVVIGENCYIGKCAEVGPETVIGNNVIIDDEATVVRSTIIDNTYVGPLVNLEDRVVNKRLLIDSISGECVVIADEHLLSETYREFKDSGLLRLLDIGMAAVLLLISLPVLLALAIVLSVVNGKIFQRYACVHMFSKNEGVSTSLEPKRFQLLRFCTRGAGGSFLRLGKWLEKRELHRLPELFNVIKGDIRMIGVKPLLEEESSRISEPWHKTRYLVGPGMTGLWYVQTNPESDFDEILVADAYYAATHSAWGDIKLYFQTLRTWLRRL